MPSPYHRRENYLTVGVPLMVSVGGSLSYHHPLNDAPTPWAASTGGGSFGTNAGTPTGATTNPCFLLDDGSPEEYLKLDPGDILTRGNNGYNLETFGAAWVRIDALPAADAIIWFQIGGDGVGVDTTGKIYAQNGGTKQGTEAGTRVLGEWFHLAKMNDAGGGGTGTWVWINGVRVLSLGGAGGVKNGATLGSANFDGALAHHTIGGASTAILDANIKAGYLAGATKMPGARGAVLL